MTTTQPQINDQITLTVKRLDRSTFEISGRLTKIEQPGSYLVLEDADGQSHVVTFSNIKSVAA